MAVVVTEPQPEPRQYPARVSVWDREHRIPTPPGARDNQIAMIAEDFAWYALHADPAVTAVTVLDLVPTVGHVTLELAGGSPATVLAALDGNTLGGLGVHVRNA